VIFAAFRVRSFRFQWSADLITSWAFEMESIILGWYVMVHTGSVLWLTAFGALQFVGTLIAPMFGVLGDRLGGRIVLCAMRATYAVFAAFLTVLVVAGWLTPAWVIVLATLAGLARSNDIVLRNTLIAETIPADRLIGALGLSRATTDSAKVVGALTGAGLSTLLGLGPSYAFVACCYVASFAFTLGIARRAPVPDPGAPPRGAAPGVVSVGVAQPSRWRDLVDGLTLVTRTPGLLAMMLLAFLINLTAYPFSGSLLPYVAKRVFDADATGLGWLVASFSVGGFLGSITTVLVGGLRRPERSTFVCTAIWYALLFGFGHTSSLGLGLLALLVAGFFQNVAMISMTGTLIAAAGEGFRGRVMGVRMLAVYGMPLGLVALGFLIERMGYVPTISATTIFGLLFTILIALRWRASVWETTPTSAAQRV
jgi:MFS family permease